MKCFCYWDEVITISIRNKKQFRELSSPFNLLAVAWSGTSDPSCSLSGELWKPAKASLQPGSPLLHLSPQDCMKWVDCHACMSSGSSRSALTKHPGEGPRFWHCCPTKAAFEERNCTAAKGGAKWRQRLPCEFSLVQIDFPNPLILSELILSNPERKARKQLCLF